jgi:hypothetical protein
MDQVIQMLQTLQQFYEQLPPQPPRPELSKISRERVRTLFLHLTVRCPELYNDLSQPIPLQLLTAFQSLNNTIHQKFHTEQIGSFIDPLE